MKDFCIEQDINPETPAGPSPQQSLNGISMLPTSNGITGAIDDAHFVYITTSGGSVAAHDVQADYLVPVT